MSRPVTNRPARTLWALAAIFFGPLLVAILLYAGRGFFGPFGTLENPDRELIADPPTIPLEPIELDDGTDSEPGWARSQWSLIYARMRGCEEQCQAAFTRLHQVYESLGADRDRVRLVFLAAAGDAPTNAPADVLLGRLETPRSAELIRVLGPERLEEGRYFVVDPLGNVILSYPDDADQSRLLKDLERLLDVSRVG
jgi:cytochrome oxidase Cu insertion factor (SCO1/SenC/PrrC family)